MPDALKAASDRLSQAAMKIGEHVYKAEAAAGAGAAPEGGAAPEAENVVDAESRNSTRTRRSRPEPWLPLHASPLLMRGRV